MADKITRTSKGTKLTVLCINTDTCETSSNNYVINFELTKENMDKVLRKLKLIYDDDNFKLVKIINSEIFEELREMSLDTWVMFSKVVEKKTNNTTITRTTKATKYTMLCLNCETCEPYNETYILSGNFTDEKATQKLQKMYDTPNNKLVKIVDKSDFEELREMSQKDWMDNSAIVEQE